MVFFCFSSSSAFPSHDLIVSAVLRAKTAVSFSAAIPPNSFFRSPGTSYGQLWRLTSRSLTPSLPWCHFKTTNKSAKFETIKPFCLLLSHWYVKGSPPKRIALKVDLLQDKKIDWLQARLYTFQPGNFTGWGSEGVKLVNSGRMFWKHWPTSSTKCR